jgi:hypothetical protein
MKNFFKGLSVFDYVIAACVIAGVIYMVIVR